MRISGFYDKSGFLPYFIPYTLPPREPSFTLDDSLMRLYGDTMLELGKLNELAHRLPDLNRFLKSYVIKEALLSSSIEGIHTTLLDVFTQPLSGAKPNKDTQLVMNYTKALSAALVMMRERGCPISSRVVLEAHKALMSVGEGDRSDPGHFRKLAVRVGPLVPPPASEVPGLMADLEKFIHEDETLPALIKTGLMHVQFETIHPFLDGNGRIGRLFIVLMLIEMGLLSEPLLYPSYYFKKHQLEYYQALDRVRSEGDFEGWVKFFLMGIKESCIDARNRVQKIEALHESLIQIVSEKRRVTKALALRLRALEVLFHYPVLSVKELQEQIGSSYNTADAILKELIRQGLLVEISEQKRGKLFKFAQYLAILEEGTQPL